MPSQERQWSAHSVHRSLLKLYLIFWLCVVLHLHGVMHREVWPWGPMARLIAAVPPITPIMAMIRGQSGPATITMLATAVVAGVWLLAVRKPTQAPLRVAARGAIVVYWLVLWFPIALGA
jgi:hypothetical protein